MIWDFQCLKNEREESELTKILKFSEPRLFPELLALMI